MSDPAYPSGPQGYSQAPPPPAPQYGNLTGQYPPPPPGPGYGQPMQPMQPSSTTVVMAQPQMIQGVPMMRESPVTTMCPHCQATITTTTIYETGSMVWISAGVICILGFWLGCCLIPFCISGLKDVVHVCPNCRQHVGRYNRM